MGPKRKQSQPQGAEEGEDDGGNSPQLPGPSDSDYTPER